MRFFIFCLLFQGCILSLSGKESFVRAISNNKYGYELTNSSDISFRITHQVSPESSPITFTLEPSQTRRFSQKVDRAAWIQLDYPQSLYEADQARYKQQLNQLLNNRLMVDKIFGKVQGTIIGGPNSQDVIIEREYYDGRKEYQQQTQELISSKIILGLLSANYFGQMQANIQQKVNAVIANATISQNLWESKQGNSSSFTYVFERREIYREVRHSNYWYIGSSFHFEYTWNIQGEPGQNGFWRNSAGQGWMLQIGLPLEFSTSAKHKHACRFYLSLFEDRVRHRTDSTGDYYIPRSFVKETLDDREYYNLNDGLISPKLNATRYGAGLGMRWGPVLFGYLSVTAGATFLNRSLLHLRFARFSEGTAAYQLSKHKLHDAIRLREQDTQIQPYFSASYGFIPGIKSINQKENRQRVLGMPWIISVHVFPPVGFIQDEDYELFIGNGPDPQAENFEVIPAPVAGTFPSNPWHVALRLGVGLSL